MNLCFHDMLDEFITIYPYDLWIYSRSEAEHEVHFHQVFDNLHEETLFVKHKKSEFGKDLVEYLGNIVR